MMVMAPAVGATTEELLQDTLKSIIVVAFTLVAAVFFFEALRKKPKRIIWHHLMWLPIALMVYALGSMWWSHAYLAGVEAIRWFIFSLILFLGLNSLTLERVNLMAWCIHLGAALASLWAALQFWLDLSWFPQGPNPASTFVNRNFFGEFIICTIPFSVLLLMKVRDKTTVFFLTFSLSFNIVALMMTGTRSALIGLVLLLFLMPTIVFLYRKQVVSSGWRVGHVIGVLALLVSTILNLGSIDTTNPRLYIDFGPGDAIDRSVKRLLSIGDPAEYTEKSFSLRAVMWRATGRMISDNPWAGVGSGAWEVQLPRYQEEGSQLETDYYAHNEVLQLLAEYGITGWLFLLCLLAYLSWAAVRTYSDKSDQGRREAPLRATVLASLLVFLLVSNAGFPWRMASTGALFALCLSMLCASDWRMSTGNRILLGSANWKSSYSVAALAVLAVCAALATFITQQAILCESKIVRSVKIAMTIAQSGNAKDLRWNRAKEEMLQLMREGVAINPHYRKLTPIVADALASWGDWRNATWIWESVLDSRPYIVAILANATRGNIQAENLPKATEMLARAKALQPKSSAVTSLEVLLLSKLGKDKEAAIRAKEVILDGNRDYDLVKTAYFLGMRNRDPELAILALEVRIKTWPAQAVDGWMSLGRIYDAHEARDEQKALDAYRKALEAAPPATRNSVFSSIPNIYHSRLGSKF
jgi:O-antigen ligase